jgi:hypothetical protein
MPTCKRCDKRVEFEEEHYNDGIGEDGNVIFELAGWVCTAIDWNKLYKEALVEIRLLKAGIAIMHSLVDLTSPDDPVGVALTKAGLERVPTVPEEDDDA